MDGVRLLGKDTIDLIFREQQNGIDVVLGALAKAGNLSEADFAKRFGPLVGRG